MDNGLKKLHLGCFDQVLPGWINTDVTPHIFVSRIPGLALILFKVGLLPQQRYEQHRQRVFRAVRYLDVTKRFPYADGTFDYVYSSHLLEHLYHQRAIFCVNEIYRILKKGGIVRIAVPDLDRIIASYDSRYPEKFLESIFEAKQKRDKNKHHWHYTEISLAKLLNEAGFCEVYRCEFRQGRCVDVTLIDNRPESLFMEAVK
jgi:SAM-dependent methyltransferase